MIEIHNLAVNRGEKELYKNFDLTVETGEKFVIMGKIGCGKTTLFNILTGFDKNYTGDISIAGKNIKDCDLPNMISFIGQNPDYQLLTLNVKNEVEFLSGKKINKKIIRDFELERLLERNPMTLSSSEKRKVLFAGVFLADLPYLILDEPTADLDKYWSNKILDKIWTSDKTIIIFTHRKIKCENIFNIK